MPRSSTNLNKKSNSKTMLVKAKAAQSKAKLAESQKEVKKVEVEVEVAVAVEESNSDPEDWETLYVGPSEKQVGAVLQVKQKPVLEEPPEPPQPTVKLSDEELKVKASDEELTLQSGIVTDQVLEFMNDSEDDPDSGFTVVKSKGTKAKERREARNGALQETAATKVLPKKKFSVLAEDKFITNNANAFGNSYVNWYILNEDKCRDAFNSVDNDGNPTNEPSLLVPKQQTILFGLNYTETMKDSLWRTFMEKPVGDNTVIFSQSPNAAPIPPTNAMMALSDSDGDLSDDLDEIQFLGAAKRNVDLIVEVSNDRKHRVYKNTDNHLSRGIRMIAHKASSWDEHYALPSAPPGIHITAEEREMNMAARQNRYASNWQRDCNASYRNNSNGYVREVQRAICGDTADHPEPNTPSYWKAAENYALFGDNFMDFPPDIYSILGTDVSTPIVQSPPSTSGATLGISNDSAARKLIETDTDLESVLDNLSQLGIVEEPNETEAEDDEAPPAPVSQPVVELVSPIDLMPSEIRPMEGRNNAKLTDVTGGNTAALTGEPLINFNNNADMQETLYHNFAPSNFGGVASFNGVGIGPGIRVLPNFNNSGPQTIGTFIPTIDHNNTFTARSQQNCPPPASTFMPSNGPNQTARPTSIIFTPSTVNNSPIASNVYMAGSFTSGGPHIRSNFNYNSLGGGGAGSSATGGAQQQYTNNSNQAQRMHQHMGPPSTSSGSMFQQHQQQQQQPRQQQQQQLNRSNRNNRTYSTNNIVLTGGGNTGGTTVGFGGGCPVNFAVSPSTQQMHFTYPHQPPPGFRQFGHAPNANNDNTHRR